MINILSHPFRKSSSFHYIREEDHLKCIHIKAISPCLIFKMSLYTLRNPTFMKLHISLTYVNTDEVRTWWGRMHVSMYRWKWDNTALLECSIIEIDSLSCWLLASISSAIWTRDRRQRRRRRQWCGRSEEDKKKYISSSCGIVPNGNFFVTGEEASERRWGEERREILLLVSFSGEPIRLGEENRVISGCGGWKSFLKGGFIATTFCHATNKLVCCCCYSTLTFSNSFPSCFL